MDPSPDTGLFLDALPSQLSLQTNVSSLDVSSDMIKKQTAHKDNMALTDFNTAHNLIATLTSELEIRCSSRPT